MKQTFIYMKEILKTALTVAVVTLAVACAKEKPVVTETPEKITVSIDGIMGAYSESAGTKSEIETVARLKWNNGDKVYAYDGTAYLGELTASVEETDRTYAKLSGSIDEPSGEKPITLVHSPLFAEQPEIAGGKISLDFSNQASAKVPFLVYSVLPAGTTAEQLGNNYVAKFTIATAIYKCNVAGMTEAGAVSKLCVSNTNTVCNLQLSDSEDPVVTGSVPGVISRTDGFTAADQRAIATVALVQSPEATERKIEVYKGTNVYNANFSTREIAPAKSYNAVFAMEKEDAVVYFENGVAIGKAIAVLGFWTEEDEDEEDEEDEEARTQTILYWAPVNCGYEETGKVNTDKDHRLGKLYQWGAGDSNLPYYYEGTKVVARELYYDDPTPDPWYDGGVIIGTTSDKWKNNQGPCPDGWRLPKSREFAILCGENQQGGNDTWVSAGTYAGKINTYAGAEFFGANADKTAGKGVFFPAAGDRLWNWGNPSNRSIDGHYWTSEPDPSDPDWGIHMEFNSSRLDTWTLDIRSNGYSVRCVSE